MVEASLLSKVKPRRKHSSVSASVFSFLCRWRLLARIAVVALLGFLIALASLRVINPPTTALMTIRRIQGVVSGKPETKKWSWVESDSIALIAQQSIVAAEDAKFMDHLGIDVSSLSQVVAGENRKRSRGASTITMQTVKNLFLWPGRSYVRKGIEIVLAPVVELLWGKRRILEIYLNVIEFGEGIYGIEAASRHYFGHSAEKLTASEAASLAAILPLPRVLSPKSLTGVGRRRYRRILAEAGSIRL
jgi:monofunctional biosynthetic peptidoglycan transglycosylase